MRKVWITGASGFTGSHLYTYLRSLPDPVELTGFDVAVSRQKDWDNFLEIDLNDLKAISEVISKQGPPDYMIHLAGLFPPAPENIMWKVNVGAVHALLQAFANVNAKSKTLIIGSAAEYLPSSSELIKENEPCGGHSSYGRTKWAQTVLAQACAREWGLSVCIARTFNLLGPGLSPGLVGGRLAEQFRSSEPKKVKVGKLSAVRDFLDVRDAVSAYWTICEEGSPGEIYNVCRGECISIACLLEHFIAQSPYQKEIVYMCERDRSGESDRVCGDCSRLRSLGWKTRISIEQSVRDMLSDPLLS